MKKIDDMLAELKEDSGFQTLIKKYESPNCFTIMDGQEEKNGTAIL